VSVLAEFSGDKNSDELCFKSKISSEFVGGVVTHFQSEETEYELDVVDQFVF